MQHLYAIPTFDYLYDAVPSDLDVMGKSMDEYVIRVLHNGIYTLFIYIPI